MPLNLAEWYWNSVITNDNDAAAPKACESIRFAKEDMRKIVTTDIHVTEGRNTLPSPKPPKRKTRIGVRPPVWFLAPAVIAYTIVVVVPNLRGFAYSFTDWNGISSSYNIVGFENFNHLLDDPGTASALKNTLLFTIGVAILQNIVGLGLALVCNSLLKSRQYLRLVFFLPVVLTPIVTAYLWTYLLNPTGTINELLVSLGLESWQQDWLGNPKISLISIVIAAVWQGVGYTMVIYLAGLQNVSQDVLEAAAIDGAGPARRFFKVIFPLINASVVINILLTLTSGLKQFDLVFAMTNGGPAGATQTLSFIIFKNAFVNLDYPTAVAQGVVLTLIVAIVAVVQLRLTSRKEPV